jgi:hypothetical protein
MSLASLVVGRQLHRIEALKGEGVGPPRPEVQRVEPRHAGRRQRERRDGGALDSEALRASEGDEVGTEVHALAVVRLERLHQRVVPLERRVLGCERGGLLEHQDAAREEGLAEGAQRRPGIGQVGEEEARVGERREWCGERRHRDVVHLKAERGKAPAGRLHQELRTVQAHRPRRPKHGLDELGRVTGAAAQVHGAAGWGHRRGQQSR